MSEATTADPGWVLDPLLEAGLGTDEICDLLFGVAFDDLVGPGSRPRPLLPGPLADRPAEVRLAWLRTVGRMLALSGDGRPPGS